MKPKVVKKYTKAQLERERENCACRPCDACTGRTSCPASDVRRA